MCFGGLLLWPRLWSGQLAVFTAYIGWLSFLPRMVGRVLARQTDAAMRALVGLWRGLRPRLLQRDAVLPRIWAT